MRGIEGEGKAGFEVAGDQLQQGGHAAVGGVLGVAALQGGDGGGADRPGGNEVGLADAEGNRALRFAHDVEKFTYPARLKQAGLFVDEIAHRRHG